MTVLRNGELTHLPCFSELEIIHVPGVGHLEAFVVAGGGSTAPWTFRGQLQTYELKVCRYPGTFAQLKAFSDLGLVRSEPSRSGKRAIRPARGFPGALRTAGPHDPIRDVCLIGPRHGGFKDGRQAIAQVDLVDRYDEATGFTAMERTTGWHAAIVAAMLARGEDRDRSDAAGGGRAGGRVCRTCATGAASPSTSALTF